MAEFTFCLMTETPRQSCLSLGRLIVSPFRPGAFHSLCVLHIFQSFGLFKLIEMSNACRVSEGGSNSFSLSEQLFLPLPIKDPGCATKAWDSGVSSVSTVMVARKLSPHGPFMTHVFSLRQPPSAPHPQTSIFHLQNGVFAV